MSDEPVNQNDDEERARSKRKTRFELRAPFVSWSIEREDEGQNILELAGRRSERLRQLEDRFQVVSAVLAAILTVVGAALTFWTDDAADAFNGGRGAVAAAVLALTGVALGAAVIGFVRDVSRRRDDVARERPPQLEELERLLREQRQRVLETREAAITRSRK